MQTGMLDYTGEKYDHLPPGRAANLSKIMFVKNLLANTRKVLRRGANVAVLCVRFRLHNNLQFHEGGSCALWRAAAATQFAIGRLKTQKEGQGVPDIAMDVRDSLEVEKKEHDEPEATPPSCQDEDKFSKCECMAWRVNIVCLLYNYFSIIPLHQMKV